MMRTILISIGITFLTSMTVFSQNLQDVVYLKNGGVMHGIIIEQIPNQSIKIQTYDKNIFVYKIDEIEKMTKEEVQSLSSNGFHNSSYLYPGLSLALSFLYPGAGQFYNGQYSKGAILAASSAAMLVVTGLLSDYYRKDGIGGYGCIWLYSMIDAPIYASSLNRKNKLSYSLTPSLLNLAMDNKLHPGVSFFLRF